MRQEITDALSSVTTSAVIATNKAGMLPGMQVVADMFSPAADFAGSAKWQTSVDGTTWVDAGVAFTTDGFNTQTITLAQHLRLNCTARSAGSIQGRILSDIG